MSGSYGIVDWEYPNIKGVKIPEERTRFTFPDWLRNQTCDECKVDQANCVFCAFSAQSASKNTAIRIEKLNREDLTIFLGILYEAGWSVYLLDAGKMRQVDSDSDRFNINYYEGSQGYYRKLLKEEKPILENANEGGGTQ